MAVTYIPDKIAAVLLNRDVNVPHFIKEAVIKELEQRDWIQKGEFDE